MNNESLVCSIQLSQRLKELNVEQESLYYYYWFKRINQYFVYTKHEFYNYELDNYDNKKEEIPCDCSAFTIPELLFMLPTIITIKENEPFDLFTLHIEKTFLQNETLYIVNYRCNLPEDLKEDTIFNDNPLKSELIDDVIDESLTNALAQILISHLEGILINN